VGHRRDGRGAATSAVTELADARPTTAGRAAAAVRALADEQVAETRAGSRCTVVSDDPSHHGYRGRVETLVPTLRDWARLGVDVLVAGPKTMIATTVTSLAGIGIPLAKIHFDRYDAAA
jgi:NAD(P)H-flavin reductase